MHDPSFIALALIVSEKMTLTQKSLRRRRRQQRRHQKAVQMPRFCFAGETKTGVKFCVCVIDTNFIVMSRRIHPPPPPPPHFILFFKRPGGLKGGIRYYFFIGPFGPNNMFLCSAHDNIRLIVIFAKSMLLNIYFDFKLLIFCIFICVA